jgi:hypothetical protein
MNDSISILLATTVLALGGLGLYMYKSTDDNNTEFDESNNEDSFFGGSFWNSNEEKGDYELENLEDFENYEDDIKPRKRSNKTQRNRKSNGASRRRY